MTKRIISAALVGAIVLTMSTTVAFASQNKNERDWLPPGISKKVTNDSGNVWLPPGIAKKAFDDVDKFPWAQKAIEKMKLKGLVKGKEETKFAPQSSVTKLETIIMALRIMGWEEEVSRKTTLPNKYKGKEVGEWAKGYVTIAFEKGLLDDVDMMYFSPNEPAKRHEVAKYIVRAIGYEDEAQDHMDDELSFKDAPAIPQGSVGYVYLVNEMKLMIGNDGKFNPMGTLTRAEMAVLFDRLDEKVDNNVDEDEYEGEIYRISDSKITIKIDGELKSFDVSDDVVVYYNDNQIRYSKLDVGNYVLIQLENDEVAYIEVTDGNSKDDKIISQYTGVVTDITEGRPAKLTVQIDRMQVIFEVNNNALIYFKNVKGSFDEIENGDTVSVTVDARNRAREIRVNRDAKENTISEVKGTITDVDLVGTYNLFINGKSYQLSQDAKVSIPGKTNVDLEDLEVGYKVVCVLEDDIITTVDVESAFATVSGEIEKIGTKLTLIANGVSKRYECAEDIVVTIDGQNSKYSRLTKGMTVVLKIKDDLVYQIDAENIERKLDGKITSITQVEDGYKLTLTVNDKEIEYLVADDVKISVVGVSDKAIEDLKVNQEGKFLVENNLIKKVYIIAD